MKYVITFLVLSLLLVSQTTLIAEDAKTAKQTKKCNAATHLTNKINKQQSKEIVLKCPISGTNIDLTKAYIKKTYKGKMFYFCCPECLQQFTKHPDKYVK